MSSFSWHLLAVGIFLSFGPKTEWNTNLAALFTHTSTLCSTAQILIKHHNQMELNRHVHTNFPAPHWCPGTGAEKKTPKVYASKLQKPLNRHCDAKKGRKGARGITHSKPPPLQFSILLRHQEKITFVASQVKHNKFCLFLGRELKWPLWKHGIGTQM